MASLMIYLRILNLQMLWVSVLAIAVGLASPCVCAAQTNVYSSNMMIWGEATNGLRAGFDCPEGIIRIDATTAKILNSASLAVGNCSSNIVSFFWPEIHERDILTMVDSSGRTLPQLYQVPPPTSSGSPKRTPRKRNQIIAMTLKPGADYSYGFFNRDIIADLGRMFCLTNPGNYELTRHAQVIILKDGDPNFQTAPLVILPPVTIKVRVEEVKP